jgi:two-component system, NarL family, response regulator NreC
MMKIMIVDDHQIFREGLVSLFADLDDIEVVGEAEDGIAAIRLAREVKPRIIIMDVKMSKMNGIAACRQIISELPNTKVIALTMHSDEMFVSGMLKAGARGYLRKDCDFKELLRALNVVDAGHTYFSPDASDILVNGFLRAKTAEVSSLLTSREEEVLQLLAEGKSTKEAASILFLSPKTIDSHRRQIMRKLDLQSVAQLTKYAIRKGLTSHEH